MRLLFLKFISSTFNVCFCYLEISLLILKEAVTVTEEKSLIVEHSQLSALSPQLSLGHSQHSALISQLSVLSSHYGTLVSLTESLFSREDRQRSSENIGFNKDYIFQILTHVDSLPG